MVKSVNYEKTFKYINKLPVYSLIIDWQRPGSGFFQSSLDDHPEILQLPGIIRFRNFWNNLKIKKKLKLKLIIDKFMNDKAFRPIFNSKYEIYERWDKLGKNRNQIFQINQKIFKNHMIKFLKFKEISARNFFIAVLCSYFLTRKKNPMKTKIIFIHLHRYYEIKDFEKDFPNSNYLLISRDLRNGLVSYMESREGSFYYTHESFHVCLQAYARVFDLINPDPFPISLITKYKMKKKINNLKIISYENLSLRPQETLKKICKYLQIKFVKKIMFLNTVNGLIWWGDKGSIKKITGFNPEWATRKRWSDQYSFFDLIMINSLFEKQMHLLKQKKDFNKFTIKIFMFLLPLIIFLPMRYELKIISFNLKKIINAKKFPFLSLTFYNKVFGLLFKSLYFYAKRVKTCLEAFVIKFKINQNKLRVFGINY